MSNRQRKGVVTEGKPERKSRSANLGLTAALRSFIGHLEGTGKSRHTIASYRFDLQSFEEYLRSAKHTAGKANVRAIARKDLERYHEWLKQNGQKTNTRRRKLMTVRKFMHYLAVRKKLDLDVGKKLPAPEKVERVPLTLDASALRSSLLDLPIDSHLALRNTVLLLLLLETGLAVSEAAKLRWSMIDFEAAQLRLLGKSARDLALSSEMLSRFEKLKTFNEAEDDLCFVGFNRHGPVRLGKKSLGITSRGVELLVKSVCSSLGHAAITPRTLRHSAVVAWYRAGVTENEIQKRLGLKTAYAFRIYQPIFAGIRSSSEATSIS